jgi:hypothetical protein
MNAVEHLAGLLSPDAARRLAARPVDRFALTLGGAPRRRELDAGEARRAIGARWGDDLIGLLNACTRGELAALAGRLHLPAATTAAAPALRAAVWDAGAALERGGSAVTPGLQPRPVVLGGHLVIEAPPRGAYPPAGAWPRPVPARRLASPPAEEPETLDELLAAADLALGVPLGPRGRDKGAWGVRAARLLGVIERGADEPDWRGDVELKTIPVAREPGGRWRVVEDPAIAMLGEGALAPSLAKLQRVLWLCRCDLPDGDATLLSWYLLEWDPVVARLAHRYLHLRPKGPAGTTDRAVYLSRRFFADAGLLPTLNGPP